MRQHGGICLLACGLVGCATQPPVSELAAGVEARIAGVAAQATGVRALAAAEQAAVRLTPPARLAQRPPHSQQGDEEGPREALLDARVRLSLRGASLREVFDAIAGASGLQFVFDPELDTAGRLDLDTDDRRVGDVLQLLGRTRGFEHRFLFREWVLIYPATENKRRQHAALSARSVRLVKADLKQVPALLNQLAGLTDLFVDEGSRVVFMRGRPEALQLAEHLLNGVDLHSPEVLVELEILEVARDRLSDLGLELPAEVAIAATTGAQGNIDPGVVRLGNGGLRAVVGNPALIARLRAEDGVVSRIARPRLRVSDGEKGSVKVGTRLPVFTTTANAQVGLATAVTYLDTGVMLEVEPRVVGEREVDLRLDAEFSDVLGERTGAGGERAYRLATQRATSALRLRDGEPWVLVGADRVALTHADRSFGMARSKEQAYVTRLMIVTPRILRVSTGAGRLAHGLAAGTTARPGLAPLELAPGAIALRHDGGPRSDPAAARAGIDMQTIATPVARLQLPDTARPEALVIARVELEGLGDASEGRLDVVYEIGALESLDGTTKPGSVSRPFKVSDGRASVDVSFRVKPDGDGTPGVVAAGLRLMVRGEEYEFPLSASGTLRIRD